MHALICHQSKQDLSLSLLSNELIQTEGETKTGKSINPIPNGRTWKSFQNNYTERYYEVWITKLASLNICSAIPFTQGSQVTSIEACIWASFMFVIAMILITSNSASLDSSDPWILVLTIIRLRLVEANGNWWMVELVMKILTNKMTFTFELILPQALF